ncbi:MAG: S-layer homology domain-containing protein [Clostridiales bacterium]|jgi:5'-nucleotidase|nr:S-layer homology domain-containing protein [Clostridiales bacterium]
MATEYAGFADIADIADYAAPAVAAPCRAGVISGKPGNIFVPKDEATRAERVTA